MKVWGMAGCIFLRGLWVMLACQRHSGWERKKKWRAREWGEKTEGEVQEEHLKANRISFIHEHLSALCNRLWYILEIWRTRWTMTFTVHTCLIPVILATWGLVEWLKPKNTCLSSMRPWVWSTVPSESKQTNKLRNSYLGGRDQEDDDLSPD
jgi:hypothetical protein